MARYKDNDPAFVIGHWLRLRNTIEYMGTWETLHNPNFKPTDLSIVKRLGRFSWCKGTALIGMVLPFPKGPLDLFGVKIEGMGFAVPFPL